MAVVAAAALLLVLFAWSLDVDDDDADDQWDDEADDEETDEVMAADENFFCAFRLKIA